MTAVHLTRRHMASCRFPVHHKPKYTTFQVSRTASTRPARPSSPRSGNTEKEVGERGGRLLACSRERARGCCEGLGRGAGRGRAESRRAARLGRRSSPRARTRDETPSRSRCRRGQHAGGTASWAASAMWVGRAFRFLGPRRPRRPSRSTRPSRRRDKGWSGSGLLPLVATPTPT